MDFSFPETHTEIQALALKIVNDHSSSERLKKLEADGPYFDKELWRKFVETSLHSASLAEALGGMGMDYAASSMVAEAIGHHAVSIPYIPCVVSACLPLQEFSDNQLVSQELSRVIEGSSLLTTAFIEPYNENPSSPKATVTQSGDRWLLDGVKHCVPYAADASKILLAAMHGNELWAGLVDSYIDAECLNIITLKACSDVNQGDYNNDSIHMAKLADNLASRYLLPLQGDIAACK